MGYDLVFEGPVLFSYQDGYITSRYKVRNIGDQECSSRMDTLMVCYPQSDEGPQEYIQQAALEPGGSADYTHKFTVEHFDPGTYTVKVGIDDHGQNPKEVTGTVTVPEWH